MEPEIFITQVFDASISEIWNAITDRDKMANWYFDLNEFKPEMGFIFEFLSGPENGIQYNHICEITNVEFEKKLAYTWQYEGYQGHTLVSFELSEFDNKTKLVLTHSGLSSFPSSNPDFAISNFRAGWDYFINTSLMAFIAKRY